MDYQGLTEAEVHSAREKYGVNRLLSSTKGEFWSVLIGVVTEPLFLLLVGAASIYFLVGEHSEGFVMLGALLMVSGISLFQEAKSRRAVKALNDLNAPVAQVYRSGELLKVVPEELVVGDTVLVEDGDIIPADGVILEANDFLVNESMLTGESISVHKNVGSTDNVVYSGTSVMGGRAVLSIASVGEHTALGKLGRKLESVQQAKTPLQLQIRSFVRSMVVVGAVAFILVCVANFLKYGDYLEALMHGLTLAMSILPEEIPVAFSTFMALGAYRLYQSRVIARSPYTVETLGAATVICADKTGTLTENRMELRVLYSFVSDEVLDLTTSAPKESDLLEYAMWASEEVPFDAMERSIHHWYSRAASVDRRVGATMVHEYPLGGSPPMMTHVFVTGDGEQIVAAKGSLEAVVAHSELSTEEKERIAQIAEDLLKKGFRLLGVGKSAPPKDNLPLRQFDLTFKFLGILAFYDPPKEGISDVLSSFYRAGISVKMITGDHPETALAIAKQIKLENGERAITGKEISALDEKTLKTVVSQYTVFARMHPEAKLRVIEALKENGEVVAMTGDGVNDGLALKAAHIGVAMGKRGTDLAKKAAALVLVDDDLNHMPQAVALGRRIFENLKKAIRYIISIHIPIILIVLLPLLLGWEYVHLFTPIHVIFLELIMGPTCSIVFEREPIEPGSMDRAPRARDGAFFSIRELAVSLLQGLAITAVCLGWGYSYMIAGASEEVVRTIVFSVLVFSNLFLTLVNRSFYHSMWSTLKYPNPLMPVILTISLAVLLLSVYMPEVRSLFGFSVLSWTTLVSCAFAGFLAVIWMEGLKFYRRKTVPRSRR